MDFFVLLAAAFQALVGVFLLLRWWRGPRRAAGFVALHVSAALAVLALWIVFVAAGALWSAWAAFAVLTVGNSLGDELLRRRARGMGAASERFWKGYGDAIVATVRGRMPPPITFHALFAGVVYFGMLLACILASLR